MGGCATKPKVLKDAPAPEPANDDKPSAAPEPPVVVVVGVTEGEKIDAKKEDDDNVKEIVEDDKRRSLSILFKENEEGKDSTEDGKPAVEPLKQEEVPPGNIKPTYESETTLLEVEKTEILVEQSQQTPVPDVVVDHAQKREIPVELIPAPHVVDHAHKSETPVQHTKVESEKITESTAPTAETKTAEKKTEVPDVVYAPHEKAETEKTTESTAPTAETKTAEKKTEVPDVEREKAVVEAAPTSEEKKKEAPDVGSAKEEVKAEKANEAAVGTTETQNYGTSEEKKTEVKGSHAPEEKAINV